MRISKRDSGYLLIIKQFDVEIKCSNIEEAFKKGFQIFEERNIFK